MIMREIHLIFLSFIYQFPDSWCDLNSTTTESNKLELSDLRNLWQVNTSREKVSETFHYKFNKVLNQVKDKKIKLEIYNESTDNRYRHRNPKFELKKKHALTDLIKHIRTFGKAKLKRIVHMKNKYLNLTTNVKPEWNKIKIKYTYKLKEYYNDMSEINVEHSIEHDMILLDAVEASNIILSTTVSSLLSEISEAKYDDYAQEYRHVVKLFQKTIEDEKKDNFIYICKTFSVCRHYPAFSDHVADLLMELLMYSKSDIMTFVKVVKEFIGNNSGYLKTIVDDDTAEIIDLKLQSSVKSFPKTKYFILTFTSMIRNRYKLYHNIGNSLYISNHTKAFELLIYVIDETIRDVVGDDHVGTEFNDLKITINSWTRNQRIDVFKTHEHFWQKIIRNLKRRWNEKYGEEIKALIEILVQGQAKNIEIGNMLLTEGLKGNISYSNN